MSRLDRFLDQDDAARAQTAQISSAIGFAGFLVARFLLGFEGRPLGYIVAAIATCAYLARVWWYCNSATSVKLIPGGSSFLGRRLAMAAVSASIFALFVIAPQSVVEAAVLNRRIRDLATRPGLPASAAESLADALNTASNNELRLSPEALAIARDAIKNSEASPAVARAARALVKYSNTIAPPALINPPKTEAQRAYLEALSHELKARQDGLGLQVDPQEAGAAIAALSRCIKLSGAEQSLRIDALMDRARLYVSAGKPDNALVDVESAESEGALDLSSIISIETSALVSRRQPKDLQTAIPLLTLGLQISPPAWILAADPRMEVIYRTELFHRRAYAKLLLGDLPGAASDSRAALDAAPRLAEPVNSLFHCLISAYLGMGRVDEAQAAANEWMARTGDVRVQRVQAILRAHSNDPNGATMELNLLPPW